MNLPLHQLKKLVILVIGGSVMLVGIAMIFLPGPAFIVIPAGLAILAIEFEWARRLLKRAKTFYQTQTDAWKTRKK
ncbi:MAG: PGPGW domain-containing protein [Verrucomicrobia bacterium]|nr:PGPGW domain-containing protein [Verrucomicrobiota bacterium]MCG2678362.1 PGPGW domain-containing protein [Kiritimatiellia bacterium]MBU4247343.1 PGPGW domain-containing protein [Verrucomicrobiota bacterium]MBU4291468.1 PGPGW domain-containing protein [Verrucomicrobiota bacterium]MBU4428732.1 PGPGW domain-containing protein [Verrucomicrobiota bacterium]